MSTASPKTEGLVTIRYIVMSVLNRLEDYTMKSYKRLVQITIEGFTELNLFHLKQSLEVVYLHMSTAKTVQLPADFIDYTKIGIPLNGKLRVITRKDSILLPRTFDDTGLPVGNTDADPAQEDQGISNAIFFSDHWRNGQYIGGLYGLPGGIDRAYYRIDRENRLIVFSGTTPRSEIVLEYISSGVKTDGSSLIPREAVPALRTYLLWQMFENDEKPGINPKIVAYEKERRKKEHFEEVEALRSFQNAFTADEWRRAIYSTYRQIPKR
jgi:hypothetical protein